MINHRAKAVLVLLSHYCVLDSSGVGLGGKPPGQQTRTRPNKHAQGPPRGGPGGDSAANTHPL
ncbi:hypothetical protein BOTBODRAFT_192566 [Botryobasidium botryosum FD-172 SS1]|uniref:Uncharacterized protein n=1 Tax=Botryobasidium botryosum (strain FD-172 SS1) TaxID=930990 RepID=A0A067M5K6_BOTB1|nr:hypothetical protein BOTBODRAFT_192566 [Botryobasidium botryosum FD-172 SS1]